GYFIGAAITQGSLLTAHQAMNGNLPHVGGTSCCDQCRRRSAGCVLFGAGARGGEAVGVTFREVNSRIAADRLGRRQATAGREGA
ncbi:hypothetical protein ACWDYJ_31475, partial [Streptomyces sp. NPDC003042]